MKKYLIATFEGQTLSPKGKNVENLQILGITFGENFDDVVEKLFSDNKWIIKAGFTKDELIAYELVE